MDPNNYNKQQDPSYQQYPPPYIATQQATPASVGFTYQPSQPQQFGYANQQAQHAQHGYPITQQPTVQSNY